MKAAMTSLRRCARLVMILSLLVLPSAARAQTEQSGAITGVVRDTSGAVLPGVTVEAASPALIERVRVVITDGEGVYRIVNLRPGAYSVTFTLSGFRRFVRDGIELTAAFTATVNADLAVGALQETVTVTGATSLVDTQGVQSREVYTRATVDALPITLTTGAWTELVPAMKAAPTTDSGASGGVDVGGTQSERTQSNITIHGSAADTKVIVDGVEAYNGVFSMNRMSAQEVNVVMAGAPAEAETGGVRINVVPKEGGNHFSGTFALDGTTGSFQSNNVGDDLRARGVVGSPTVKRVYNLGGALGGPIRQSRLWFFGSYRKWDTQQWLPGKYYNATQGTPFYTRDSSRPAHSADYYQSITGRLTYMATAKQKLSFSYEDQSNCNCLLRLQAENRAPEATGDHTYKIHVPQIAWNDAVSGRLLFEARASWYNGQRENKPVEGVSPTDIAILEQSTNFFYNARAGTSGPTSGYGVSSHRTNWAEQFAMTFVTGSHNFKTGALVQQWPEWEQFDINGGMLYNFRNGRPSSVVFYASPYYTTTVTHNLGLFVQDQWTLKRLTSSIGLRFDRYRGYARDNSIPPGPFVPARHFAQTDDLINLKDLNPRLGIAYDLFGNGRTAVKAYLGRFIVGQFGAVGSGDPAASIVLSATRTWGDTNGDFIPQTSELGALSNANFGNPVTSTLTTDNAVSFGQGNRNYTWQGSLSVEQELRRGLGLSVSYFRTSYGNQTYDDNRAVTPQDFDPYCITAPKDSRLPGGGGNQICGFYDVKLAKFGKVDTLRSLAGNLRTRVFDGIDVNMNARLGDKGKIGGGLALGNTVVDDCGAAVDSPEGLRFCRNIRSWSTDVQLKINGTYMFPKNVLGSVVFQTVPGVPITASYVATNAEITPTLGRNLSAGANGTTTIQLIEPNTLFEDRTTTMDLRLSKRVKTSRLTANLNLDLYNALNASTPQAINTQFGPQWLNVLNVMSGRLLRFGVQIEF